MESKKKEQVGPKSGSEGSSEDGSPRSSGNLYMLLFFIFGSLLIFYYFNGYQPVTISESFFSKQIRGEEYDGTPIQENGEEIACNIAEITFREYGAEGKFRVRPLQPVTKSSSETTEGNPTRYKLEFFVGLEKSGASDNRANYKEELIKLGVDVKTDSTPNNAMNYLMIIALLIPVALLMYFWYASRRAQDQMLGGGGFLSSFSRSPAQRVNDDSESISFDDVAGLEGVKADLQEIVDYLKDPAKFQKLGGRVPKGVLLNGSPGTGKTLLARAVAGEADVPFYSVNGSEFIQMFVGVGASRVRDLFKQAKETSPAIIFIDEIDAVGRQRGAGLGGGHDEREQTLNQILGEMDGFAQNDSVIVVAATNRADVLDPALLRPGRFDRHIAVNRPTKNGRLEIFKVHVREVPLAEDVDLMQLAVGCIGMTGADIRNVVNEAALWAARQNKNRVEREDFSNAMDKIRMGSKREEILSDEEKEKTAYHEAGHTITGWFLEGADPVQKVSVIPRGQALGLTMSVPEEDRVSYTEDELRDRLVVYMGGRAAEKVVYDERLVGAQNDIERATHIARRMVTDWGMSQKIGPVSFKTGDDDPFLGREMHQQRNFSEHTMEIIDEEVSEIIRDAMERAISMLTENRDKLDALTKSLIEHEELEAEGIEKVLGPSVHQKKEQWASKLIVDTAEDSVSSDSQNGQEKTSPIAEEAN